MPYEALNEIEYNRNLGIRNAVSDTLLAMGNAGGDGPISSAAGMTGAGISQVAGALNPFGDNTNQTGISLGANFRIPTLGYMRTMWANFAAQRDLEIFKMLIRLPATVALGQIMNSEISELLIEKNKPGLSQLFSNQKNSGNPLSNLCDFLL